MQDIVEAILFGFKEILDYHTMKLALLVGGIVSVFWTLIAYFVWDTLVSISSYFINVLPFSVLRSDGVWLLSSFSWFVLVLITFALFMTFFGSMILEKVSKDRYSVVSLGAVFTSAVFWSIMWFFYSDTIHEKVLNLLNLLPFQTIDASMAYLLSLYFVYGAIIVTMLIATSFFSEDLLKQIKEKHFPYDPILDENKLEMAEHRGRDIAIYTLISLVAFPLLFVPVVNFIIQIALWIWIIKDILTTDTAALIIKKENQSKLKEYKVGILTISGVTAVFNFLPVFNIFGPFFGEIAMFHYMKDIKKEMI